MDLFKDHSISLVYIDAQHDYYNCMLDMRLWWDKLIPGGVLAGHDYDCFFAVRGAVQEFARKMSRSVYFTNNWDYAVVNGTAYSQTNMGATYTCKSWYIIK